MRKIILTGVVSAVALSLFAATLSAAPFEPLFQLQGIVAKTMVLPPGGVKMVKAEENRAYPYGTRIQTDKRGTVTILLSEGNTVTLAALTEVRLNQSATKTSDKILVVDRGSVDVKLDPEFHQANGFDVITPVAACKAIGCEFNVLTMSQTEIDITTFSCAKGDVSASGPDFKVPALDKDDIITVTTAKDGSYSRLEVVQGNVDVEIRDAAGQPQIKKASAGMLVKIWRRTSESGLKRIVTILVTTPDGTLEEAITYTEDIPAADVAPAAAAVAPAAATAVVAPAATPTPGDEPPPPAKPPVDEDETKTAKSGEPRGDIPPAEETDHRIPAVGSPATLGVRTTPIRAAVAAGAIVVIPPRRGSRPDPTPKGAI